LLLSKFCLLTRSSPPFDPGAKLLVFADGDEIGSGGLGANGFSVVVPVSVVSARPIGTELRFGLFEGSETVTPSSLSAVIAFVPFDCAAPPAWCGGGSIFQPEGSVACWLEPPGCSTPVHDVHPILRLLPHNCNGSLHLPSSASVFLHIGLHIGTSSDRLTASGVNDVTLGIDADVPQPKTDSAAQHSTAQHKRSATHTTQHNTTQHTIGMSAWHPSHWQVDNLDAQRAAWYSLPPTLRRGRLFLLNGAVSDTEAPTLFHRRHEREVSGDSAPNLETYGSEAFAMAGHRPLGTAAVELVPSLRLSTLIHALPGRVQLLRLSVVGSELRCLRGAGASLSVMLVMACDGL